MRRYVVEFSKSNISLNYDWIDDGFLNSIYLFISWIGLINKYLFRLFSSIGFLNHTHATCNFTPRILKKIKCLYLYVFSPFVAHSFFVTLMHAHTHKHAHTYVQCTCIHSSYSLVQFFIHYNYRLLNFILFHIFLE